MNDLGEDVKLIAADRYKKSSSHWRDFNFVSRLKQQEERFPTIMQWMRGKKKKKKQEIPKDYAIVSTRT